MKTKILAAAYVLTSIVAFAEVPDCTSSLEYIACPNSARWNERQKMPVCDLFFHDGKLWVGGGATELNAGPCPLQYIDPATKQVIVERNAGTENITVFKEFSDGRLYVPSQDPRDYDSDYSDDGFIFVRNGDNDWTFYKGCAQQQQIDSVSKNTKMGGFVHVWDAEEYAGNIFIGGYGISRTPDFGATWKCATPSWKYGKMALHNVSGVYDFTKKVYKTPTGVTDSKPADGYGTYRRELQFMKFKDRLFAIPYQYVPSDVPTKYYDAAVELHRYDEATGNFYEMTNKTSRVFPGLSNDDFNMSLLKDRVKSIPSMHTLKLWHTTPFSNRVFYVVSPYDTYTNCWGSARKGYKETQYPYPMFACAADPSSDGMFTSERLDFGHAEEYPFDFLVKGDRMYALTVKYDSADKLVRHSVWVTTDAHNFTRLITFKFHQYLISMEYGGGCFYFGAGYKGASQSTYQLNTTADCAGNVYRIEMPQEEEPETNEEPVVNEPRDVTADIILLGNPAKSRWPSSAQSRHVQDLHPYQGKIYTSGGEWGNNTGPCPCFAVDPYSGAYENEFDAGTDAIYEFKTFSDGLLYCSAVDPHEGATYIGHTFRREANGSWKNYSNCVFGGITNTSCAFYTHNWDMAEYKGKVFVCGYGISGSDSYCATKMYNASPSVKNYYRVYTPGYDWTSGQYTFKYTSKWAYRRFCAFLPFDDDLFCIPTQLVHGPNIKLWKFEEWRLNESTGEFTGCEREWSDIAPGVTDEVASMTVSPDMETETTQLWHPTKFKNRVLYILGGHDYNITPWAAFSAENVNHHVKATRIDLGSVDVRPFDIYPTEDAVYLVAAEASKTTTTVTNSIWKSTDGVTFTKLLWFTSTRQASALCYYDGSFYVGMGSNADTKNGWPKMTGTDVSGNIYRIPYAKGSVRFECETAKLSVTEGGLGTARFRLTEKPSANVTAKISTSGAVSTSVKTLTFTTSNWNAWQSVAFSVGQDEVTANQKGALVCGGVDGIVGGTCMITILNDDFAEKEVAPAGLVDLTTPEGTFTHDATTGVVTMKPFNNAATDNDTNNRVCVQQKHFSIVYEFPSNAMVNAYSIKAMTINSYAERAPSEWKFFASDDNSFWTELDHRRWEVGWKSGELRYHTCANTKYYKYYKIEFLGNNGNEYIQFARLEYYGEFEQSGDKPAFVKGTPIFYEGFSLADYPELAEGTRTGLNNGPVQMTASVGMGSGKWNVMGSAQPSLFSSDKGLALPAKMAKVGFSAVGTSAGMNPESNYTQPRGAYHGLADGLLSSSPTGKFVIRLLMNADSTAMNALTGSDNIIETTSTDSQGINYYGAGFVKKPSVTNYGIITSQPNALAFFLKKMKDGSFRAVCRAKGTDGTVTGRDLGAITPGRTYIFYAEVTLRANGDIIRAGYQDVAAYSENLPWQGTMTNEVFSASDYPDCVAIGGGYGTKGGYFCADEFAIGTKLNDVLFTGGSVAVEPTEEDRPEIGDKGTGVAFSKSASAFEFSISNVKAGFYYTAYVTDDLAKPFVASDICIRAEADGSLAFSVPTSDKPSLFVKVVVSSSPKSAGDPE